MVSWWWWIYARSHWWQGHSCGLLPRHLLGPEELGGVWPSDVWAHLLYAYAAMSFLIPIGVVVYAAIGGLKATFTTSYMHTVIIFVLCLIFMFKVFVPNDLLGGIDDVRPILSALSRQPLAPDAPSEVSAAC